VCKAPYTKPVKVTLDIYRPIQKSGSKALRAAKAAGEVLPVVKPDIDNVFKAVTDAVKGIAWVDDNQICVAVISKRYSDTPRIEMKIDEI
jgi:Holliday junction resolvase RusA-like endonuclease